MTIEIVSFPIKKWWFSLAMLVYQRVVETTMRFQTGQLGQFIWTATTSPCDAFFGSAFMRWFLRPGILVKRLVNSYNLPTQKTRMFLVWECLRTMIFWVVKLPSSKNGIHRTFNGDFTLLSTWDDHGDSTLFGRWSNAYNHGLSSGDTHTWIYYMLYIIYDNIYIYI